MRHLLNSVASVTVVLAACTQPGTPAATNTANQALDGDNGVSVNGISVNGISVNGVSLNGVSVNGISVNGVSVNGTSVNGVSVNGVSVNGTSVNGTSVNGTSVNGTSVNGTSVNGTSVNGTSVNGTSVNGTSVNGTSVNGTSINGTSVNGTSVNGTSVNGTSINGTSVNGTSVNGTDFIGATMTAVLSNGGTLAMRIDDIAPLTGANADVLGYAVSMLGDDGWHPVCGTEPDGSPVLALAVPGVWNLSNGSWSDDGQMFSLACRHASVAKCVEFGYKSWLGLGDHHHACVRMLRADYCGDGTPHTITGTLINLYDDVGVQGDAESWPVDAEWGPDGALCINHNRGGSQPSCYAEKFSASCGSFDSGALLVDEYNGGQ